MAEAQTAVARSRGLDTYFVTRRGFRDNLDPVPADRAERGREAITGALDASPAAGASPTAAAASSNTA